MHTWICWATLLFGTCKNLTYSSLSLWADLPCGFDHGMGLDSVRLRGWCAIAQFPKGFEKASLPSGKGYIRTTPQPNLP